MDLLKRMFGRRENRVKGEKSRTVPEVTHKPEFQEFSREEFDEVAKIARAGLEDSKNLIKQKYGEEQLPVRIGNSGLYASLSIYSEMLLTAGAGELEDFWRLTKELEKIAAKISSLEIYGAKQLVKKLDALLSEQSTQTTNSSLEGKIKTVIFESLKLIQGIIDMMASNFAGFQNSGTDSDRLYSTRLQSEIGDYEFQTDALAPDRESMNTFALPALISYANSRILLGILNGDKNVVGAMKQSLKSLITNTSHDTLTRLQQQNIVISESETFNVAPDNRAHGSYIFVLNNCVNYNGIKQHTLEFYFVTGSEKDNITISKGVA